MGEVDLEAIVTYHRKVEQSVSNYKYLSDQFRIRLDFNDTIMPSEPERPIFCFLRIVPQASVQIVVI